jgi:hypothetical protein
MDIPKTLAEVRRVLADGGSVFFSVHPLRFTLRELRASVPHPVAMTYRIFVLLNGIYFHFSGKVCELRGEQNRFRQNAG